MNAMNTTFRLCDFNVYNEKSDTSSVDSGEFQSDNSTFMIQMFGINELGESCSIIVHDFKPFFYVKVPDSWGTSQKTQLLEHIQGKMGTYHKDAICDCNIVKRKKLYGFDGGKDHKFIIFKFENVSALNKAKNLWYYDVTNKAGEKERRLMSIGYRFNNVCLPLYEANIPPLLRFFHIQNISPSGWVSIPLKKATEIKSEIDKKSNCDYEYLIKFH